MLLLLLLALWAGPWVGRAAAEIIVNDAHSNIRYIMNSMPSDFGPMMPLRGLAGYLVQGRPQDGCYPLTVVAPNISDLQFFVLLELSKNCTPTQQVHNAERAGFRLALIHNVGSDDIYALQGQDLVHIPSLLVGESDGLILQAQFLYGSGYFLVATGDYNFTFLAFFIPGVLACCGCLCLLCGWQLCRCISTRRRRRRRLLPQKILKDIPTKKFEAGSDPYDTCAICLEDYADGDVIRKLPCQHVFHRDCVDPWLTRARRVCPVCKRHVMGAALAVERWGFDSDEEAGFSESDDGEQRPLIRPRTESRQYGTSQTRAGVGAEAAVASTSREAAVASTSREAAVPSTSREAAAEAPPLRQQQVQVDVTVHTPAGASQVATARPRPSRARGDPAASAVAKADSERSSRRKRPRMDDRRRRPEASNTSGEGTGTAGGTGAAEGGTEAKESSSSGTGPKSAEPPSSNRRRSDKVTTSAPSATAAESSRQDVNPGEENRQGQDVDAPVVQVLQRAEVGAPERSSAAATDVI